MNTEHRSLTGILKVERNIKHYHFFLSKASIEWKHKLSLLTSTEANLQQYRKRILNYRVLKTEKTGIGTGN